MNKLEQELEKNSNDNVPALTEDQISSTINIADGIEQTVEQTVEEPVVTLSQEEIIEQNIERNLANALEDYFRICRSNYLTTRSIKDLEQKLSLITVLSDFKRNRGEVSSLHDINNTLNGINNNLSSLNDTLTSIDDDDKIVSLLNDIKSELVKLNKGNK